MRIFAVSDLHTDFRENRALVEGIPLGEHTGDALIVAGDIADGMDRLEATLALLRARFREVFFVPGNHELWVRGDTGDSVDKFNRILRLCDSLGVRTRPARLEGVWIVPLFSWYEAEFDSYDDAETGELEGWADFHFCRWPEGVGRPCDFFLGMNESHLRTYDAPVVSFSHFLPRRDLLPPAKYLRFRGLPQVAGCAALDAQVRRVGARVHVFGHSHIDFDQEIEGVRYVQNALRYPRDRTGGAFPLRAVWDPE
ncbi:MAG TPA: metallophosphoesterase [Longimicrobiaceae bacterium]|nr:metallophosphoesterase [Longimicrobiaceae bacterium]